MNKVEVSLAYLEAKKVLNETGKVLDRAVRAYVEAKRAYDKAGQVLNEAKGVKNG